MLKRLLEENIFKEIYKTNTFRQTAITFSGTILNGILGIAFYIITARILGPASYGLLGITLTTLALVADLGDFGTNTGLVRFISKYVRLDPDRAYRFQNLGIKIKLYASFIIIATGYLTSSFLANNIFNKPEIIIPLRIAFLGVLTTLLFSFTTASLQSMQKFWTWSGVQIFTNLLRLIIVLVLFYFGIRNPNATLVAYIAMPLVGFFIGLYFIPINFIRVKSTPSDVKEFIKYSKWVGVFLIISSLGSRLDSLISARLLTFTELGIYAAATQLVFVFPQLISAIGTVISPKFSSMGSFDSMLKYYKKLQIFVIALSLIGLFAIPLGYIIIPLLYGVKYTGIIPVFSVLVIAMLVFLISTPIHNVIIYYYSHPKLFFRISAIHLIIIAIAGWVLIGKYGILGGAFAVLIAQIMDFIIPAVWLYRKIRNNISQPIN